LDPNKRVSLRKKQYHVKGKNKNLKDFDARISTFDYVRLSYKEYLEIIKEWYYKSAI